MVSANPDLVVSGTFAQALCASAVTGFELCDDPVVTRSSEFVSESSAGFPIHSELIVFGPGPSTTMEDQETTDFSRQGSDLLVSERALALLNDHRITHASLTPSSDTAEAARITALLDTPASTSAAPDMKTQNKRRASGDLTRAVAALGAPIDDEKALTVLRLVDGPITVTDYENGDRDYLRGEIDGSDLSAVHISLTPDATVRFVQLNFRSPTGDPATAFPRINSLIDGASPFTRDTVIDLLGDPAKTTTVARHSMIFDEYRVSRKRVLFYWDADDHSPQLIVVGRKS